MKPDDLPIPEIIYSADADGVILSLNAGGKMKLEYGREQPLPKGCSIFDFYAEPELKGLWLDQLAEKGRIEDFEISLKTTKGEVFTCLESGALCKPREGRRMYWGVLKDIHTLKNSNLEMYKLSLELDRKNDQLKEIFENSLRQEKMASLGQLSGGLAHQINNPLGFIVSNLKMLKVYTDTILDVCKPFIERQTAAEKETLAYILDDMPSMMDETLSGLMRIEKIVKTLSVFSGSAEIPEKEKSTTAGELIRNLIPLLGAENQGISIETELKDTAPLGSRADELRVVLLNLIQNSVASLKKARREQKSILIKTAESPAYLTIAIQDNGDGIAPDIARRIFEPFFTTGETGETTGMGLSLCHELVVNRLGGTLQFKRAVPHGVVFIIELPLSRSKDTQ